MRTVAVLLVLVFLASLALTEPQRSPALMPVPASVKPASGELAIGPSFTVAISAGSDTRLQHGAERFLDALRRQTGMLPLDMKLVAAAPAGLVIHANGPGKTVQEVGEDESYALEVTNSGATLNAPTTLGVLRGLQTFLQLVQTTSDGYAVPAISIQDAPRFTWRGLMIDSGRHFIPLDVIKRNLDGMEAVKMSVFHWHLSENQGFRIESKKFPKLQQMGSDGLYYTQEDVREVIAYARERGIRVVPEFDMPGHSTAWFVGYPELASAPGPYEIERKWGVFDPAMAPTKETTYKFLDTFIGEMAALFPDQYFHIGGDEVNGKQWDANPKIQEFMRAHKFEKNDDLQAYFNTRVQKIVSKYGKTMMGWDEILRPDLPKDILVHSWRGQASLAQAAKLGYRGILSNGYYLDLIQPTTLHYATDPLSGDAANLSGEEKKRVLGGEACMWSEFVGPETIDSRIWPRAAAIAERLWSPQQTTDVSSMYARMETIGRRLDWLGLTHNTSYPAMLRRIAGSDNISALRTLTDVVEPVKGYDRPEQATTEPTSATPLNRLVDAARPESMTAIRFGELVKTFTSGDIRPGSEAEIRGYLTRWRDNSAGLQPLAEKSFLVKETMPLSQDLSALGAAGLQALDYLDRGERAPDAWRSSQLALVEQAAKPKAQLLIMVVPAVKQLIEATGGMTPQPARAKETIQR